MSCASVIWMTVVKYISKNDFWLVLSYRRDKLQLVNFIVHKKTIAHFQVFSYQHFHMFCSCSRFIVTGFDGAPRSQFSLCKIYYAGTFPCPVFIEQSAGA